MLSFYEDSFKNVIAACHLANLRDFYLFLPLQKKSKYV
jgi:hypothetical protein